MKKSNTIYNTFGTFFYFLCQWLLTIFVVRLSDYKNAGIFSLVISTTNIFYCISLYGVRNYQVSDINEEYSDSDYFILRILTTVISFVIFICCMLFFGYDSYMNKCCFAYIFYKYGESLSDLCFGYDQKYDLYKNIAFSYVFKGIFTLVLFCVFLYVTKDLFLTIVSNIIVYFLVIFLYDVRNLRSKVKFNFENINIRPLFKICLPLMFYVFLVPYLNFVTRFVVEKIFGSEQLGYYSSITMIVSVLSTLTNSIFVTLIPNIRLLYLNNQKRQIINILKKSYILFALLLFILLFLGFILGNIAFSIIFGKSILPYVYLLPYTIITSILLSLVSFSSSVLIAFHDNIDVLKCNIIAALSCSILIVPFVSYLGMKGAIICMGISLFIDILLLMYKSFKKLQ